MLCPMQNENQSAARQSEMKARDKLRRIQNWNRFDCNLLIKLETPYT